MNEPLPEIDDRVFDLLVDGELPEDQRLRLLTGLDAMPDGWRRCALAFLEAQSWRSAMPAIIRQGDLRRSPHAGAEVVPARGRGQAARWHVWRPRLALAASFLLAFTLGLALRSAWRSNGHEVPPALAAHSGAESPRVAASESAAAPVVVSTEPDDGDLQRVRLRLVGASEPAEVEWPMYESPGESARSADDPTISDVLLAELARLGHVVRRHRDWLPVQLEDGRQGLVPVDRVEVEARDLSQYQ